MLGRRLGCQEQARRTDTPVGAGRAQTVPVDQLKVIHDNLPTDYVHGWKYIRFGPDGKLYVPFGSNCNVCEFNESERPCPSLRIAPNACAPT